MFDAVKVKEDKLDAVIQHDVSLIEKADEIKAAGEQIAKMDPGNDDWGTTMDDLINKVETYDSLIDERSEILRGLGG
jgi:hypothetical protein